MIRKTMVAFVMMMVLGSAGVSASSMSCQHQIVYETQTYRYEFVYCCVTTVFGQTCRGEYQINYKYASLEP